MLDTPKRSRIAAVVDAAAYGPFNCPKWAVLGCVVGTICFMITDAIVNAHPGQLDEVPTVLTCAAVGAILLPLIAFIANYVIGRPIRDELDIQRAVFAGGKLPPPRPRPDVPGIMLGKSVSKAAGADEEEALPLVR